MNRLTLVLLALLPSPLIRIGCPMLNPRIAFFVLSVVVLVATKVPAQYHIYWGDMHGHTSHSDGKGSLDDKGEHGNRSHAWSSPIWVKKK